METRNDETRQRELLWVPSEERVANSRMAQYLDWVNRDRDSRLLTYDELWRWSVDDLDGFWRSIWDYFDMVAFGAAHGDHERPCDARYALVSWRSP